MKKIEELGISPAPWKVRLLDWGKDRVDSIDDANGETIVETDCGVYPPKLPDARILAAAPKLYGKAYEVAENLLVHLAVPSQTISMNRAEVAAMVKDLQSALAEAAGETEVK